MRASSGVTVRLGTAMRGLTGTSGALGSVPPVLALTHHPLCGLPKQIPYLLETAEASPHSGIGVSPTFGWCLGAVRNFLACYQIPWSLPLTLFGMMTPQGFPTHWAGHRGGCQHFPTGMLTVHPPLAGRGFPGESLFPGFQQPRAWMSMAVGDERTGHPLYTNITHVCKCCCTHCSRDLLDFPSSSSKD